jgi:hypothetical protein
MQRSLGLWLILALAPGCGLEWGRAATVSAEDELDGYAHKETALDLIHAFEADLAENGCDCDTAVCRNGGSTLEYCTLADQPETCKDRPPCCEFDTCLRDTYVCAALFNAWAAVGYAASGPTAEVADPVAEAERYLTAMMCELSKADQLCSTVPTFGGGPECDTIANDMYACCGTSNCKTSCIPACACGS